MVLYHTVVQYHTLQCKVLRYSVVQYHTLQCTVLQQEGSDAVRSLDLALPGGWAIVWSYVSVLYYTLLYCAVL